MNNWVLLTLLKLQHEPPISHGCYQKWSVNYGILRWLWYGSWGQSTGVGQEPIPISFLTRMVVLLTGWCALSYRLSLLNASSQKKKTNSSTRITFNVQYMKYEQKLMNLWNTAKKKKPKKSSKCFIKCSKWIHFMVKTITKN